MNSDVTVEAKADVEARSPWRAGLDLFLISLLILFLELACIRWFPSHVLFLTFFTNVVLLACFLGMSVGCLAARHRRNYLAWTPPLLLLALAGAHGLLYLWHRFQIGLDVGGQRSSPQFVFFGAEEVRADLAQFVVPIEAIGGFFFVVVALVMVGPGQELGRAFNRMPDRISAYTVNILGSLVGIVLFAVFSLLQLSPLWWFLAVFVILGYFLLPKPFAGWPLVRWAGLCLLLLISLGLADFSSGVHTRQKESVGQYVTESLQRIFSFASRSENREERMECFWSPYYRVDYDHPPGRGIQVNMIPHQVMHSRSSLYPAYALPYLLNRDTGGQPIRDVLIIGAGSGNDVSRALQWCGPDTRIDAVEIDPVIQRLGARDHPDRPYDDKRVTVHLDDGRNFLHSSDRQYDLIIYALVDSLVLHSSYSNIRLESYLFTRQAFEDVKKRLKTGGLFAMYNFFRQGWIVARLNQGLEEVFGKGNPLILTLPYQAAIEPEQNWNGFTLIFARNTAPLREQFQQHSSYWLAKDRAPDAGTPNGFLQQPGPGEEKSWRRFGPAELKQPADVLLTATDDWPFLYLRQPMIPDVSLRGAAIMGGLALLLIFLFLPRGRAAEGGWSFDGRMFFLGAGFMLIETKAVVNMALLFGSTWMVNSVVFFAVLVMILGANLFVVKFRPVRLGPYYAGLLVALALNCVVPLEFFLGMNRVAQVAGSCLLVFAPVLFAGVIFAVSFGRTAQPDLAFGANIAGAMLGGLAEYTSMLLGFRYLMLLAIAFYVLSALRRRAWVPVVASATRSANQVPAPS